MAGHIIRASRTKGAAGKISWDRGSLYSLHRNAAQAGRSTRTAKTQFPLHSFATCLPACRWVRRGQTCISSRRRWAIRTPRLCSTPTATTRRSRRAREFVQVPTFLDPVIMLPGLPPPPVRRWRRRSAGADESAGDDAPADRRQLRRDRAAASGARSRSRTTPRDGCGRCSMTCGNAGTSTRPWSISARPASS